MIKFAKSIKSWILNVVSMITSVACMGSVATVSMVGMSSGLSTLGVFLQAVGLGFLTTIPDSILRPILIFVIAINIIGAYLSYRKQRYLVPFSLTIIGAILLYPSIYIFPFELLYYFSLILLLIATVWNISLYRKTNG